MQWFVFNEPSKTYVVKSGEISYMCYDKASDMTHIVLCGGPWLKVEGDAIKPIKIELKKAYQDVFTIVEGEVNGKAGEV